MYNIDFDTIVKTLLPVNLRKSKTIDFLKSLIAPLKALFSDFNTYRLNTLKLLSYNGQVISIQKKLNDDFDDNLRRIFISNLNANVFSVNVNNSISPLPTEQQVHNSIDRYVQAGPGFLINYVN